MSKAIEEEQQKQKDTNFNKFDRQWNTKPIRNQAPKQQKEDDESSDSFEVEVNNQALGIQSAQNDNGSDSDEFELADSNQAYKFK